MRGFFLVGCTCGDDHFNDYLNAAVKVVTNFRFDVIVL